MDAMLDELLTKYSMKLNRDSCGYHNEDIPPPSEPWRGAGDAEQVACEATWHDGASNFVAGTSFWNLYLLTLQGLGARWASWH